MTSKLVIALLIMVAVWSYAWKNMSCAANSSAEVPEAIEFESASWDYHAAAAGALADLEVFVQSTSTTTTTAPKASPIPAHSVTSATSESTEAFFECVRWRESRGDYTAVNPTGTFRGAYQFYQGGWDNFARQVAPDYVGVPPDQAPAAVQDAVAHAAYAAMGKQPWGGAC